MRSAETSGVEATGFETAKPHLPGIGNTISNLTASISPVTLAVAITALVAATLFVVFDVARTLDDTRSRMHLIARSVMVDIDIVDPALAGERMIRRIAAFDPALRASLINNKGKVLAISAHDPAFDPISARFSAEKLGTLALETSTGGALAGVWQRGLLAFGAAALMIAASLGRRPAKGAKAKDHLTDLIASIPSGVACWSAKGALLAYNGQYCDRIGVAGGSLPPGLTYHAAVQQLLLGGYMRIVADEDNNRTLELHRQDGSCLMIDERPLPNGGFITLVSDVTERKRTDQLLSSIQEEQRQLARRYHEEKLRAEAASRSKTSFLAHLSHDIRTPLNHIIGFAELIRHQTYGPLGDARYLGYVDTIKGSGERLLASFATILELAELESGQKALRRDTISVDDVIVSATRRFGAQAARAGVVLKAGAPAGAAVVGDRLGLERALGNLIENAIRFTPTGGKVTVSAFAGSDGVVLEVADTGIGMTEDRLAQLSQPFSFGDAAFAKEHEGAGLGIAIARAIVELSGGRLAIDSSPALGTTVAVSLPMAAEQQATLVRAA